MRAIDVLHGHAIGCWIVWPLDNKDFDSRLPGSMNFLVKTATHTALLSDYGLGMQSLNQRCRVVLLVVNEVLGWKASSLCPTLRFVTVQDAEPAFTVLPVISQFCNGIDTGESQQALNAVCF